MERTSARDLIIKAWYELIGEVPYDKISVRALAERASVSTVTFYKHFSGKEDVYRQVSRDIGKASYRDLGPSYTWYDFLLETIRTNREMRDATINVARRMDPYTDMVAVLLANNEELLQERIGRTAGADALNEDLLMAMRVYLYGILHVLRDDAMEGMSAEPEALARRLALAMPELLRRHVPLLPDGMAIEQDAQPSQT